jgi:hypothetical protein
MIELKCYINPPFAQLARALSVTNREAVVSSSEAVAGLGSYVGKRVLYVSNREAVASVVARLRSYTSDCLEALHGYLTAR